MKKLVAVAVVLVAVLPLLATQASAEDKIPKKRMHDGVYTSPNGDFTLKIPYMVGGRSEERQTGPATWGVFFASDLGRICYVLPSDNSATKKTLEDLTADIVVGDGVRTKETIQSARGAEVRVTGVAKNGSPLTSVTEKDGKRVENHPDLAKASSLFLHGDAFYEVTYGVTRVHDDQTDDELLERAKQELDKFLSGLVFNNR